MLSCFLPLFYFVYIYIGYLCLSPWLPIIIIIWRLFCSCLKLPEYFVIFVFFFIKHLINAIKSLALFFCSFSASTHCDSIWLLVFDFRNWLSMIYCMLFQRKVNFVEMSKKCYAQVARIQCDVRAGCLRDHSCHSWIKI